MTLMKVASYVGLFLRVNSAIILAPVFVALLYGEDPTRFIVGSLFCFTVGLVLSRNPREELSISSAIILSAATFVGVSFFGAVPFLFDFGFSVNGFVDAFFESASGYTTTGLSVIDDVGGFDRSVLFFRSLTQWIGGIGIIVLSFSTLSEGLSSLYLFRQEHEENQILPSVGRSARMIIKIYFMYSIAGFVVLWLLGVGAFPAVNNVFTSLSSGGFAASELVYSGLASKLVVIALMCVGAFSFTVHYLFFSGEFSQIFRKIEVRALIFLLFLGFVVFTFLFMGEGFGFYEAFDKAVFNSVSAVTTTGYSDVDFAGMSDATKMVTSLFMIVGGGIGSTAGGIKVLRVIILLSAVVWFIRKSAAPKSVVLPFKLGGRVLEEDEVTGVWMYFFLYVLILSIGVFFLMFDGIPPVDSFFVSSSALGTVGLSTVQISSLSIVSKSVLSLQMLFGRVEIISMLVLMVYLIAPLKQDKRLW